MQNDSSEWGIETFDHLLFNQHLHAEQ